MRSQRLRTDSKTCDQRGRERRLRAEPGVIRWGMGSLAARSPSWWTGSPNVLPFSRGRAVTPYRNRCVGGTTFRPDCPTVSARVPRPVRPFPSSSSPTTRRCSSRRSCSPESPRCPRCTAAHRRSPYRAHVVSCSTHHSPAPRRSSCRRRGSSPICTPRGTVRCMWHCRCGWPPTRSNGWAVAHPLAGIRLTPGMVLVYGPRDEAELDVVTGIVMTSHAWAAGLSPRTSG